MLPPIPSSVFLCTAPQPPYTCTEYHHTLQASTRHLLTTHSNVDAYTAAFGEYGLRSLSIRASLQAPTIQPANPTTHTHTVFVCPCCLFYFPAESTFIQHLEANGTSAAITALTGSEGVLAYVRTKCRRLLVLEHEVQVDRHDDRVAEAVDAIVSVGRRNMPIAQPGGSSIALAQRSAAGPSRASTALGLLRLPSRRRRALITANPVEPLSHPIRIVFSKPFTSGTGLVNLCEPTILALTTLISAEYAKLAGPDVAVDWPERFERGVPLRYEMHDGSEGTAIIFYDRHLEACFGLMEYGEICLGDERG